MLTLADAIGLLSQWTIAQAGARFKAYGAAAGVDKLCAGCTWVIRRRQA
jgi:hypothetical protein